MISFERTGNVQLDATLAGIYTVLNSYEQQLKDIKVRLNKLEYLSTKNESIFPIYANNAAAVAGGLTKGMKYRTNANPDFVAQVH
jgi:hypothetical protein